MMMRVIWVGSLCDGGGASVRELANQVVIVTNASTDRQELVCLFDPECTGGVCPHPPPR